MTNSISAIPEVQEKVAKAKKYIQHRLYEQNLFGFRFYLEDVKSDIELYIYEEEEKFRTGKRFEELGVGAYCRRAWHIALNYAAYYSTQKRRLNFESFSIQRAELIEENNSEKPTWVSHKASDALNSIELFSAIEAEFGADMLELVQKAVDGEKLSSYERFKLRSPKMRALILT